MLRLYELIKVLGFGIFFAVGLTYGSIRQAMKGHWGNAGLILGLAVLFGAATYFHWRRWKVRNPTPPPTP